jgi:hypothetical protein
MLATVAEVNMSTGTPVKVQEVVENLQSSAQQISPFQDSEGLIPVHTPESDEVYYIVDCPALHLIEATILFSDGYCRGSDVSHSRFHSLESRSNIVARFSLISSRSTRSKYAPDAPEQ